MKKDVLVVFKTHLDIGFTDLAENVIEKYKTQYIPNAIQVGYELKDSDTPFIWTVGSWLLHTALKDDPDHLIENAIKDGILHWHGLPFTLHTELMNEELLRYAMSLSQGLCERFDKKTVSAKMTDVPGHTVGIVPILADNGIEFLHIGVNPITPVPDVPPIFRWHCDGKEITVMYQQFYGDITECDDFILYFAHTSDNIGPQSAKDITDIYDEIRQKFPGHRILAATLDDVAQRLKKMDDLPVLYGDIGDTWIYGAASDPQKISRYRALLRHIEQNGIGDRDISDHLLLVPEHTWGLDIKAFLPIDGCYSHKDMPQVDRVSQRVVRSWQEQRDYVTRAEAAFGITPEHIIAPDLTQYSPIEIAPSPDLEISWQLFNDRDYQQFAEDYLRPCDAWTKRDFCRADLPQYESGIFVPTVTAAYQGNGCRLYHLEFDAALVEEYGLAHFWLKQSEAGDRIELIWLDKAPSRLPHAFWLKFKGFKENWTLHKLGRWIKPEEVLDGSLLSAVDLGVKNDDVIIRSQDAALVAPYGRNLLKYGRNGRAQDLYFNLYNNVWNTNFPTWNADNAMFRFEIEPLNR